ncbi:chloride channel protein [compost metagenome]
MSAYLAGVTRTPLTATVITIELSHSPDMLIPILAATLLASAISSRISRVPIYHALARQMMESLTSGKRSDC